MEKLNPALFESGVFIKDISKPKTFKFLTSCKGQGYRPAFTLTLYAIKKDIQQ